ncbi:mitochondrial outer membrane protein porin 1-like [Punica granatum]|uniref:Uncharacterized protein n=2 Tax=Punica granatum TaxID=22663 RepID=A0A2I0K3U0_PUNGR|nr:mitochondrial outer membrane protein porin 1-like [Punica granatum]PKI63209.1 hypothetical protein CRG98_016394 [Punica granatum]
MSWCPGLYDDIGEKARDILYRGYARQPAVHFQYRCLDVNGDISFRVDDILPGFGTVFRAIVPYTGKAELQYLHDYFGITAGIGLTKNSFRGYNPILSFSGVIGTSLLSLGTDIAFNVLARKFDRINAGLGFNTPFLVASLTINDKLDTLRANLMANPLTNMAIAAEAAHRFSVNETSVTMGIQQAVLPFTFVKARVSTRGVFGALVQQGFWQKLYVTVSGEADFGAAKWGPKLGLSIAVRP